MTHEKSTFIRVDELMARVSIEDVCRHYGVALPDLQRIGQETRTQCFLTNCANCGQTGNRALALQLDHPARQWKCHHYGCSAGGSLLSLMDLLAPGESQHGQPRGARFKQLAQDLQQIAGGVMSTNPAPATSSNPASQSVTKKEPERNIPLIQSTNERARELIHLDQKFRLPSRQENLPPAVGSYFRKRPWLTDELAQKFRMGYLPRDSGGDTSGGTQRGKIVYPWLDDTGQVLTWFGRNPNFEAQHAEWLRGGKVDREPEKVHFIKGFQRGLELWNQHTLFRPETASQLTALGLGLLIVEGPNDVMRLDALGVPAVAPCSCQITPAQIEKISQLAARLQLPHATLMLDLDEPGLEGSKRALELLAQLLPVRLAWHPKMLAGQYAGKQPENLTAEQWSAIAQRLQRATTSLCRDS